MKALYKSLFQAIKELNPCPMTGKGNFGPYSTVEDVISHTKDILSKHGLFIIQRYRGKSLITDLVHAESGEVLSSEVDLVLEANTPQKLGAATTYSRRFSILALLGLASDGDPDSIHGVKPATQPRAVSNVIRHQPAIASADERLNYVITFGKFKDRRLGSVPMDELANYIHWMENKAKEEGKPMTHAAKELRDIVMELQMEEAQPSFAAMPDDERIPF